MTHSNSEQKIKTISIIIPNLNSPILNQVLNALYSQLYVDDLSIQIIIVGQDKYGFLNSFSDLKFIYTPFPVWPAVARNIAIQYAEGELILFLDADCIPKSNWIFEIVRASEDHSIKTIIGGAVSIKGDNLWALADNLSSFHTLLPTKPSGFRSQLPTCNLSVRQDILKHVGQFDETLRTGEDTDWVVRAQKQGFSLYFHPKAEVWHRTQRHSLKAFLQHAKEWGYTSIVVRHRYPDLLQLNFAMKNWWMILIFSPFLSIGATINIFISNPSVLKYIYLAPIIWSAKMAWCFAAAKRMRRLGYK